MPVGGSVPTLDPEEACQQAIDAGLVVHRAHPLNCETSVPALVGGVVMPNARFYMRNNFRIPTLDATTFRLTIGGLVERPQSFTVRDLQNMRSKTLVATLECAGNGRALFDRPTEGEKWGLGAVSTAEWTGVPLVEVLDRAGVRPDTKDVLFRGADGGAVEGRSESMRFERSLRLDDARDSDVLLAYASQHGEFGVARLQNSPVHAACRPANSGTTSVRRAGRNVPETTMAPRTTNGKKTCRR
jgi:DMSO/TMAO reductase YedYZ molybdopterin-dependent catalytic subunit